MFICPIGRISPIIFTFSIRLFPYLFSFPHLSFIMRIFCIGRNYAAHAAELGNEVPGEPVVFIKPLSCLVKEGEEIQFPSHGSDLHHEAEIVIEIGKDCSSLAIDQVPAVISKIGIGLDLTLRDVQSALKEKGLPWEKAKAFDCSSPLGKLVDYNSQDLNDLQIGCRVNGVEKQNGSTGLMLFPITEIVSYLSSIWKLKKGDLIYTGTPKGVGPLKKGDEIEVFSKEIGTSAWSIK